MPTRYVHLTEELDLFVAAKVESGRYENVSEVISAALRTLDREETEHDLKFAKLLDAIDQGDKSGVAPGNPFERVRQRFGISAHKR